MEAKSLSSENSVLGLYMIWIDALYFSKTMILHSCSTKKDAKIYSNQLKKEYI